MDSPTELDFTLSSPECRGIMRLLGSLDVIRRIYPKITVNQLSAFLMVAKSPGFGPTDYARMLGTIQPCASTWLLHLGPKGRENTAGLGLLDRRGDPTNLRHVQYTLSSKGFTVAKQIAILSLGRGPT